MRRPTRQIMLGDVQIGGDAAIAVQSMTKTDTRDVDATVRQIRSLEAAGCEIVRVAVPDLEAALSLGTIKKAVSIPVVADIHFNAKLALEAIAQGVDGLRIKPGKIGARWRVRELVQAAKERLIPIRIGVNAGSLEKHLLRKHGHPTAPPDRRPQARDPDDLPNTLPKVRSPEVPKSRSPSPSIGTIVRRMTVKRRFGHLNRKSRANFTVAQGLK